MRAAFAGAVALILGVAPALGAQQLVDPSVQSNPTGFHVGLSLDGTAVSYEGDQGTDSGLGLSLKLGYAPTPFLTIFARASGGSVSAEESTDDYTVGHFDIGVRGLLHAPTRRVVPFAELMYSGRSIQDDLMGSDLTFTGTGLSGGVGALVFLSPGFALDFGVTLSGGAFTEAEWQGETEAIDESASTARVSIGISWYSR